MKHDENDERRPLLSSVQTGATTIVIVLHKSQLQKKKQNWKASAVSTTDGMVETNFFKLRDT